MAKTVIEAIRQVTADLSVLADLLEKATQEASQMESPETETVQPKISLADIRERMVELRTRGKLEDVRALIKKYGASKLSEVKESDYVALMNDVEAMINAA